MGIKSKIKEEALEMFSKNGYNAVSVRDITKAVDRRETALYTYFKNKQALLDSLMIDFASEAGGAIKELRDTLKPMQNIGRIDFLRIVERFIHSYLTQPIFVKFARVMLIEQGSRREMSRMFTNYMHMVPLLYLTELFGKVERTNYSKSLSTDFLATSLYGIIMLYFQKHMLGGGDIDTAKEMYAKELMPHVQQFSQLTVEM